MELFEVVNGVAIPSVHALLIEPYKTMWEKDTEEGKPEAIKMFTYIELLCSPKKSNPFHGYDISIRPAKIKLRLWGTETYNSEIYSQFEIIRAVEIYREDLENSSPGYDLYISSLNAAHKLKDFLDDFDPDERTKTGTLILKPKDITSALKEIPDTIKGIQEGRDRLLAELKEGAKSRNNREIGIFER